MFLTPTTRTVVMAAGMLLLAGHARAAEEGKPEAATPAPTTTSGTTTAGSDVGRAYSASEVQILQELDKKRLELDRRQQALELRERLVDLMEKKLDQRVTELNQLKAQLEGLTTSASGKDEAELNQLSQIYAKMKPASAAVVMNRLDNNIVYDVLKRMPTKNSGKIMEALDPVKARFISEMMADKKVVLPALSDVSGTASGGR
jgi:flagellar motility protein MotE (MotC chaperone)